MKFMVYFTLLESSSSGCLEEQVDIKEFDSGSFLANELVRDDFVTELFNGDSLCLKRFLPNMPSDDDWPTLP